MKRLKRFVMILIMAGVFAGSLWGCSGQMEVEPVTENEDAEVVVNENGSSIETNSTAVTESEIAAVTEHDDFDIAIPEAPQYFVNILAEIKEVYEDGSMIIQSLNNEFSGLYYVLTDEETLMSEVQNGEYAEILMQDISSSDISGICGIEKAGQEKQEYSIYLAKEIVRIDPQDEFAIQDIMLTYAPNISFSDTLSSTMNEVELQSGNCSWNYAENGVMKGVVACGAHPLDENFREKLPVWELPAYQKLDHVPVIMQCTVTPDKVVVREWSADAFGDYEAEELAVTTYYEPSALYQLKPDRVYEFSLAWNEESGRGYYGEASYVLVTE